MAESRFHKGLVERAVKAVSSALGREDGFVCYSEGTLLSKRAPPTIYGHRPDVFAKTYRIVVLGEAKPPDDIESRRSEQQLSAFLHYVEENPERHMVLSVDWSTSITAKSLLRSLAKDWLSVRNRIHILDGMHDLEFPTE